jgi:hypothetical protein
VAHPTANFAAVWHALGKTSIALVFWGALRIYKGFHKSDHPDMQTVIANHEALLKALGLRQ